MHLYRIGRKIERVTGLRKGMGSIPTPRTAIQRNLDTGVEINALQGLRDKISFCGQTKAIGTDGILENQGEAGRSILQILQGLGIGLRRIRVIDAADDGPCRTRRAPDNRRMIGGLGIKRG